MYLFFDTETTGLPRSWKAPVSDLSNWPRLVQIAWILADADEDIIKQVSYIIKPQGFTIPAISTHIHGIDTQRALKEGSQISRILAEFIGDLKEANYLIAHNISFDQNVLAAEILRSGIQENMFLSKKAVCTKVESTRYCNLPGYKWPTLEELYKILFDKPLENSHDAMSDVNACFECFQELKRIGVINLPIKTLAKRYT